MDDSGGSVLQQHLDDALVAPTCRDVQRRVPFIVLDVEATCVQVVVHQCLDTLPYTQTEQKNTNAWVIQNLLNTLKATDHH